MSLSRRLVPWLLALCAAFPWAPLHAQAPQPLPKLESRVTDLTGTLTAGEQTEIETKLAAFEARKGAQLAVLMVATTAPETVEQYGIRVAGEWKLGRAKPDDGALLLIAKDDRALRIEVGYGLEGALTDAVSSRIINEIMVPLLKQGSYSGAINAGLDQMIRVVDGEALPPPDKRWEDNRWFDALPFLFVGFFIVSAILRSIFGRVAGAGASGLLAGGVLWVISSILGVALMGGLIGFVIALVGGARGWSTGSHRGGGWYGGGGGFGGGGFGGGGGGGFSGGGGGFGGGGASGRW